MIQNKYKRNKNKNKNKKLPYIEYGKSSNFGIVKNQDYYNQLVFSKTTAKDVHDIAEEIFGNTHYVTNFG